MLGSHPTVQTSGRSFDGDSQKQQSPSQAGHHQGYGRGAEGYDEQPGRDVCETMQFASKDDAGSHVAVHQAGRLV